MQVYLVPEMSCSHCVQKIEKAIHSLDPEANVAVDLDTKEVRREERGGYPADRGGPCRGRLRK